MTQATPPSTYILKELHDVGLPDPVSWWPQTIGWYLLAGILAVISIGYISRRIQHWWQNRYRREALKVAQTLALEEPQFEYLIFTMIKSVMGYLDPRLHALYGEAFIEAFNAHLDPTSSLPKALSDKWQRALESQSHSLTYEERRALLNHSLLWLKQHQITKGVK